MCEISFGCLSFNFECFKEFSRIDAKRLRVVKSVLATFLGHSSGFKIPNWRSVMTKMSNFATWFLKWLLGRRQLLHFRDLWEMVNPSELVDPK